MPEVIFNSKKRKKEEWKVCTYPGVKENAYKISNYGRVYSLLKERFLIPQTNVNGYVEIKLRPDDGGETKMFRVHRLVGWEFCDGYDEATGCTHINHINSERDYNYYENLEWVTPSENIAYSYGNYGHHDSKYTEEQIRKVCSMLAKGKSYKKIEEKTGVASATINDVQRKRSWTYISCDYDIPEPTKQASYTESQIRKVCDMLMDGEKYKTIVEKTGVNMSTINDVHHGKSWNYIADNYDFPDVNHHTDLTEDMVRKICKLLETETSYKKVSKATGVSENIVGNIAIGRSWTDISKEYNIRPSKKQHRVTEDDIIKICELLDEGTLSHKQIAEKLGVSKNNVDHIANGSSHIEISCKYNFIKKK